MKAGILTFHDGLNHGAYLQAFCLATCVQELGLKCRILNYKNSLHWRKENVEPWLAYRRPVRFLDHLQKRRAFRHDQKAMPRTPYTRSAETIKGHEFDVVILGSDVIWDISLFGVDSLYFTQFPNAWTLAYAASCGRSDRESLLNTPEVVNGLRTLNQISVRDRNTADIVEEVTGHRPPVVLDPVLLLENLDHVRRGCPPKLPPFLVVYGPHFEPGDAESIREFSREHGLMVVSIGYRNSWADRNCLQVGPLNILTWFQSASFVFTSTFHGTIFALRCRKQFRVRLHPGNQNKVSALLASVGCSECAITAGEPWTQRGMENPVCFDRVFHALEQERKSSMGYLSSALSSAWNERHQPQTV